MKKGAIPFLFVALGLVMFSVPSFAGSVDKATDAMQEGNDMMDKADTMKDGKGMMDTGKEMMGMEDAQVMEGTVTCVQADQGGQLQSLTTFDECTGTLVVVTACVQADQGGQLQSLTTFDECTGTLVVVTAYKSAAIVAPQAQSKAMKGGKQTVAGELA